MHSRCARRALRPQGAARSPARLVDRHEIAHWRDQFLLLPKCNSPVRFAHRGSQFTPCAFGAIWFRDSRKPMFFIPKNPKIYAKKTVPGKMKQFHSF